MSEVTLPFTKGRRPEYKYRVNNNSRSASKHSGSYFNKLTSHGISEFQMTNADKIYFRYLDMCTLIPNMILPQHVINNCCCLRLKSKQRQNCPENVVSMVLLGNWVGWLQIWYCQQHMVNVCASLRPKSKQISILSQKRAFNCYRRVIWYVDSKYGIVNKIC